MQALLFSLIASAMVLIAPLYSAQLIHLEGAENDFIFTGRAKTGEFTFVPKGQTSADWQEALVIHHVSQEKIPLEIYYHNFMVLLNKKSGGLFKSKIVKSGENELIFEWWIETDIPDAQHGWVKVFYSEDGLGFMRYTTKNVDLVEKIRPIWENIFSTYTIDLIPSSIDVRINWTQDTKEWVREDRGGVERYHPVGSSDGLDEQVTVELLKKTPDSLRNFYDEEMAKVKARISNVQSRLILDNGSRMLYEWWYTQGSEETHEWVLLSKENPGVPLIVRHEIRSSKRTEERKRMWERILKGMTVDVQYEFKPKKA